MSVIRTLERCVLVRLVVCSRLFRRIPRKIHRSPRKRTARDPKRGESENEGKIENEEDEEKMEIACESERTFAQNGEEQGKKEEPKYVARREREKTELTLREYARAAMRCSYSWYQRTRLERRRAVIPLIRLNIYTR